MAIGTAASLADLIAPDGLDQLTVTEDFPDPYH
jgi:hypothetical protein